MSNLSVADFKAWKRVEVGTDDATISAAIESAEEAINDLVGRQMTVAGAASARVFAAPHDRCQVLEIFDCTTVTLVDDDGSTISASNYQLEPLNGLSSTGEAVPYNRIRLLGGANWSWEYNKATISITATWGWAELPTRYYEAVKILTADILDNRDVRNGVIGFTEYAGIRVRENPVVTSLLRRLVRGNSFGVA
jgi:hypothetical protein